MKIEKLMEKSPLTVREDDFLTHARQILRDNELRAIPVLNENDRIEGVLTREGVLNITSNKSNIKVKSYIKKTPIVTPETSVEKAGKEMIQADLGALPVVSSTHKTTLEGIIKLIDIFESINQLKANTNDTIQNIMSEKVETVEYDVPAQRCWRKILNTGYSGFPVVKNNKLVGIITRKDILKAGYARFKREDDSKRTGKSGPSVERLMTTPVKTVYKTTPVKEAKEILIRKEIGRLPVVSTKNNDELVGVVDRYDILNSCLR